MSKSESMLRRLLAHILVVLTLSAPVLMHGGNWLLAPASAHDDAASAPDRTADCPQHQSKDSNCCPQCATWLPAQAAENKKAILYKPVIWPRADRPALIPLLVPLQERDDGGGYVSARSAFEAFFARTSRLLI